MAFSSWRMPLRQGGSRGLKLKLRAYVQRLVMWRTQQALLQLSDHMLRDIGVTRADAWAEADKPFWRP